MRNLSHTTAIEFTRRKAALSRRNLLLGLAAAAPAAAVIGLKPAQAQGTVWQELRRDDLGFWIEMPGEPTIEFDDTEDYRGAQASVEYDEMAFYVYFSESKKGAVHPDKWFDLLRGGQGGILGRDALKRETPSMMNGFPAREFFFESGGFFVTSRNVVAGSRTISAVVWSLSRLGGIEQGPSVPRFLNSFVLLPS